MYPSVPFSSIQCARDLFSAHAFNLKGVGKWRVYIFVICRVSVQAQQDFTEMDEELDKVLRWQAVPLIIDRKRVCLVNRLLEHVEPISSKSFSTEFSTHRQPLVRQHCVCKDIGVYLYV